MNRRKFQLALISGVGLVSLTPFSVAFAHVLKDQFTSQNFRYRLRYFRQGRVFSFWIRVSDPQRLDRDVPFTVALATDAGSANVIAESRHLARSVDSHIVRTNVTVNALNWTPGAPIYCSLRLSQNQTLAKTWRFPKSINAA